MYGFRRRSMRNIYKHFAIMMTILICVSLVSATMASGYDNTTNGEADIKSTIESYFDLQYEILSKLDIEELSTQVANNDGMFVSDSYADKFRTVMQMAVAHKSAQIVDLTYDRYNISIEYREIYISGNQALVKAFLIEQIYFNADSSIMSEAGTMHNISLQKNGDGWYITNDEFSLDGYGETYELYKQRYAQRLSCDMSLNEYILSAYSQEIAADIERREQIYNLDENARNIQDNEGVYATLTAHTYDPDDPVDYAHTYCRTSNPSPWSTLDLDCTNFISIALHQDIPMDTSGNKWYWNTRSDRSASWASAEYFRRYIYNNNSSTSSIYGKHDTYANCGLGDIIQYASDTENVWSTDNRPVSTHSSIVTKVSTSGGRKLYVSMHSYGTEQSDYRYDYLVDNMPYSYKHYLNIVRYYS